MTTTEKRHVHEIAARSLRLGMSPAHVAADESEREFVRRHSANVWDAIAAIRAGKTPADHTIPGVKGPKPNDHTIPRKTGPDDVEDDANDADNADEATDRECPACDGTGRDEDGNTCERCHGTGRIPNDDNDEDEPAAPQEPDEDEDEGIESRIVWKSGYPVRVTE